MPFWHLNDRLCADCGMAKFSQPAAKADGMSGSSEYLKKFSPQLASVISLTQLRGDRFTI